MIPIFIIGLVLSAAIGLSLGLIGGGGSILTVPILVYFLGVAPHDAVGMSLAIVGATSLLGTFLHWRAHNVDFPGGLMFGLSGVVGAFVGSPLTKLVSAEALLLIFGGLMMIVGLLMLWRGRRSSTKVVPEAHPVKAAAAGFGVGLLTGFLGVGGGFLIVPALVFFGGMEMKKAIGTSLFVIFLNCVAGLLGHMSQNVFDWALTGAVMALAVGGAVAGTILSRRLEAHRLQWLFAILVLVVAVFLVAKNYSILA